MKTKRKLFIHRYCTGISVLIDSLAEPDRYYTRGSSLDN